MENYTFSFTTHKSPKEIFKFLLNIRQWWSGFHEETITGNSQLLHDEFSFYAGDGMHITKQKLIELIPDKKIVWEVIESKLSFLENEKEWEKTRLVFDISASENETQVTFTHKGLQPQMECYNQCSNAWLQYLSQLKENLQSQ